jgi:hypothetical protein
MIPGIGKERVRAAPSTPARSYGRPVDDGSVKVNEHFTAENARALKQAAANIGADPHHLAMVVGHETIGSYSPRRWGGAGGRYMGLIQFGPYERRKYGVSESQSFREQMGSAEQYFRDRGFKPGMGLEDLYSTVLAGRPGLVHRRDQNGSVLQHVETMKRERAAQARRFLESDAAHGGESPAAHAGGVTPASVAKGPTPTTTAGK